MARGRSKVRSRSGSDLKNIEKLDKQTTTKVLGEKSTSRNKDVDGDDDNSKSSSSSSPSTMEEPPKPVSSESEESDSENDEKSSNEDASGQSASDVIKKRKENEEQFSSTVNSRFFAPYRSLGIVAAGRGFHLMHSGNSQFSFICVPIGERFQLVGTNKLDPVLVSQCVPRAVGPEDDEDDKLRQSKIDHRSKTSKISSGKSILSEITHCLSDQVSKTTVVAHGASQLPCLTLYYRTQPLQTISLLEKTPKIGGRWSVQSLLSLGSLPGEEKGDKGKTMVICVVLAAKISGDDEDSDSDDDDDDDHEMDGAESSLQQEGKHRNRKGKKKTKMAHQRDYLGQVVMLLASSTRIWIQNRVKLTFASTFRPVTAEHPSTYLNKVVLGGYDITKSRKESITPAMILINVRSGKMIHKFSCLPQVLNSRVTAISQSPAIDTVAVGTDRGMVHLVNLRHDTKLFSLRHRNVSKRTGGDILNEVKITSISFRTDAAAMNYNIAPMAVGRSDGTITVWDLTAPEGEEDDEDNKGVSLMGRTILCELNRVHKGGVAMLQYLPQEPLLLSVGYTSNSLLLHIFDDPDHSGRILRQRKGHTAPPRKIRYLHSSTTGVLSHDGTDARTCQILSSGGPDRTLRRFSTVRSVLDREFSQGKGLEGKAKKFRLDDVSELLLPPLIDMATCEVRSRDWGDLVTIHQNHSFAYVWSSDRGAQSGPVLRQSKWNVSAMKNPPPPETQTTSVTISACGNFALVGTRGGIIYKYNIESGFPRGSYPRNEQSEDEEEKVAEPGHVSRTLKSMERTLRVETKISNLDKVAESAEEVAERERKLKQKLGIASHVGHAVSGLAVDSLNKTVISVGTDKKLILWNFVSHAPHSKSPYHLPSSATMISHVRDSNLAAIALEDFSVVLFDCTLLSIVRRFGGKQKHTGRITDIGFSPDGRTLFTSSLDSTIRVYDVPSSSCVDWMRFRAPPTSLTVSPTGEFLATTHAGQLGISMWSDRSFYQSVQIDKDSLSEPIDMDDPVPIGEDCESAEPAKERTTLVVKRNTRAGDATVEADADKEVPHPKEVGLVTLSGLPPAHWKNLFNLELVKERNKPKEPPKKPPTAPFFLQWRSGEDISGIGTKENTTGNAALEDDKWAAAWSDDEGDKAADGDAAVLKSDSKGAADSKRAADSIVQASSTKKRKVTYYRSKLATLLEECEKKSDELKYHEVTEYVATIGPSAIDVDLASLCNGTHDLEDGLRLLRLAALWLTEACKSREWFEAINAYLHRFLYLHSSIITHIENYATSDKAAAAEGTGEGELTVGQLKERTQLLESISLLKSYQSASSDALNEKMQHAMCLLRHFSRMI